MRKIIQLTEADIKSIVRQAINELYETSACLGANYAYVRHLAHDVKAGDITAIDDAAILMSKYVPPRSILIPIPNHTGKADYTLKLAQRIAQISKSEVLDILSSTPRKGTLYLQKKRGVDVTKINMGLKADGDDSIAERMHKARNVILIDNVIDSGATYEQSKKAILDAFGVDAWLLTLGAVTKPKNKRLDVIRSIYPSRLSEQTESEDQ